MKVAWLISGVYKNSTEPILQLLDWLKSHDTFDKIDIYMYIWWDKSYVGKRHSHQQFAVVEDDPSEEIREKIKPVKFVLAKQEAFDLEGLPFKAEAGGTPRQRETAYFTHFSQMRSIKRCLDLIENPEEYDMILRMRGDLCINDPSYRIPISKDQLNSNKIWIADGQYFTGWPYGDWAYFGGVKSMYYYIQNVENLFRYICIKLNMIVHTHTFLQIVFSNTNLELERWYVPLKITRLCEFHKGHLLLDKVSDDPNLDPFYWDLMNKERLSI